MQIPLYYPVHADYAEENFFITAANHEAHQLLLQPAAPATEGIFLYGEKGSGKTHLSHIWKARNPEGVLLEDLEHYQKSEQAEEALFHALNRAREEQRKLVCTACNLPQEIGFRLQDVVSRLKALTAMKLHQPDEALIALLIAKQGADRQLRIAPEVVEYAAARIERSYGAIAEFVSRLDEASLSTRREITIPLARALIAEIGKLDR